MVKQLLRSLVGLMDEHGVFFFHFVIIIVMGQVRKLHSYKLSAVCISEGNSPNYEDVKQGRYRYGGNVLASIHVCVNMCSVYVS